MWMLAEGGCPLDAASPEVLVSAALSMVPDVAGTSLAVTVDEDTLAAAFASAVGWAGDVESLVVLGLEESFMATSSTEESTCTAVGAEAVGVALRQRKKRSRDESSFVAQPEIIKLILTRRRWF